MPPDSLNPAKLGILDSTQPRYALIIANAITPLIIVRYLTSAAGAVTFAVGVLAARPNAPAWLPAAIGAIALFVEAQVLQGKIIPHERGWAASARAVARLVSDCPTTKIFAYPAYHQTNGLNDIDIGLRINQVGYGYYATKFQFTYQDLRPDTTLTASGPCPSVVWIEHTRQIFKNHPDISADQMLDELRLRAVGVAELIRSGSGALIIVRQATTDN